MDIQDVWIETYTGVIFYPFALSSPPLSGKDFAGEIRIEDIAHSLSQQCRFNGHTKEFYSVAQHCCLMARYFEHAKFENRMILAALLHDAAEAYLGDIPTPIKNCLPLIKNGEKLLLDRIYNWAGVDTLNAEEKALIDDLDECLLYSEKMILLGDEVDWKFNTIGLPLTFEIRAWDAKTAENEYLKMWNSKR